MLHRRVTVAPVGLNFDTVAQAACKDLGVEIRRRFPGQPDDQPEFAVDGYDGDKPRMRRRSRCDPHVIAVQLCDRSPPRIENWAQSLRLIRDTLGGATLFDG